MDIAVFDEAEIGGNAFFAGAKIGGNASFLGAKIVGDASFDHAKIGGNAFFTGAKIGGNASFLGAKIGCDVWFGGAKICRDACFHGAKIGGNAWFDRAEIGGNALFAEVEIGGKAFFPDAKIVGRAEFTFKVLGKMISCHDCTVGKGILLPGTDVAIAEVDFDGCEARAVSLGEGKPHIRGWSKARCGILVQDDHTAPSFWRFAQRTFSKEGKRNEADAAFYFERVARWKALRKLSTPKGSGRKKRFQTALIRWGYWFLWALDCLFLRWTTAYGASLARLFTTWFLVIGSFGAAFSMAPSLIGQRDVVVWTLRNWITGFQFSVTTFTTLGLGDFTPARALGKVLTSTEAILGGFLIALAVLVIGRKFMRQF
jgi:hypothetical protein